LGGACLKRVGKRGPSIGVVVLFWEEKNTTQHKNTKQTNQTSLSLLEWFCLHSYAPSWKLLSSSLSPKYPSFHVLLHVI